MTKLVRRDKFQNIKFKNCFGFVFYQFEICLFFII